MRSGRSPKLTLLVFIGACETDEPPPTFVYVSFAVDDSAGEFDLPTSDDDDDIAVDSDCDGELERMDDFRNLEGPTRPSLKIVAVADPNTPIPLDVLGLLVLLLLLIPLLLLSSSWDILV